MNNEFLMKQIEQMMDSLVAFKTGCQIAALSDDGKITSDEKQALDLLNQCTDTYYACLKNIKEKKG